MSVVDLNKIRAETDNRLVDPADLLRQAADEIERGEEPATSVLVLRLDSDGDSYDTGWWAANLKSSEMIALMEFTKARLLNMMMGIE